MKKNLLAATAIALALSAGSALAADLPSHKGPPPAYIPPPPLMTWTGFYVGVNAGYTFSNSNAISLNTFDATGGVNGIGPGAQAIGEIPFGTSLNNDGFIGGGQIGYNWQFNNSFVVGIETDIQGAATGSKSSSYLLQAAGHVPALTTFTRGGPDYLGTVRGRLGFLVTPTLLVYGTGGLAYGQTSVSFSMFGPQWGPPLAIGASYSDTRVGWTAGGGVEWMFAPNWSAKAEYLYYDLGRASTPTAFYAFGPGAAYATTRFDGHVVRAGLNYHFNWGSVPVVAKY